MLAKKISISLNQDYCEFIKMYQAQHHCSNRSAVIMRALDLLRQEYLASEYRSAAEEAKLDNETTTLWDNMAGDGICTSTQENW